MKKDPFVLLGLVVLLAGATGCSDSYKGERLLWRAQQKAAQVFIDPKNASDEQVERALKAYQQVIEKTPGTTSAVKAHMDIAKLYLSQEDFEKARETYAAVLKNYHQYKSFAFEARVATARTYEIQKRWRDAIDAYEDIYDRHPWSSVGMQVPLYIAQLYNRLGDTEKMNRAFERAVRTYTKQVPDAPTPIMANRVRSYLALVYQQLGIYDKAAQVLEDIVKADDVFNRPAAMLSLATLYEQRLNKQEKANALYWKLYNDYPDTPFHNAAKVRLEKLGLMQPGQQDSASQQGVGK
jgi:tetratricopeptide (TPR) repeat protein